MGVDAHDPDVLTLASSRDPVRRGRRRPRRAPGGLRDVRQRRRRARGGPAPPAPRAPSGSPSSAAPATRPGADRLLGYRAELERLGLPYRDEYVEEGDFYAESGYTAMRRCSRFAEPPTAVFAASDLMAAGAVRAAQERGSRVPDDLSLVGFDDIQLAALMQPPLTTIRQDKAGLGIARPTRSRA